MTLAPTNRDLQRANRSSLEFAIRKRVKDPDAFKFDDFWLRERFIYPFDRRMAYRERTLSPDGTRVADPAGHRAIAARNVAIGKAAANLALDFGSRVWDVPTSHAEANPFGPSLRSLWGRAKSEG